jgi:hypothetical protein
MKFPSDKQALLAGIQLCQGHMLHDGEVHAMVQMSEVLHAVVDSHGQVQTGVAPWSKLGDGACRTSDGGHGNFIKEMGVTSVEACQEKCISNSACVAIEFAKKATKCELHKVDVSYAEENNKAECWRKPTGETTMMPETTTEMPETPSVKYVLQSSGQCAVQVKDWAECQRAAAQIGKKRYETIVDGVKKSFKGEERNVDYFPPGCNWFYKDDKYDKWEDGPIAKWQPWSRLFFNKHNPENRPNSAWTQDCKTGRSECICIAQEMQVSRQGWCKKGPQNLQECRDAAAALGLKIGESKVENGDSSPSGCTIRVGGDGSTYDVFFNEKGNDKECAEDTACICDGSPLLSRPLFTSLGQPLLHGWLNHEEGWQGSTPRGQCEPNSSAYRGQPRYKGSNNPNNEYGYPPVYATITDAKRESALCTKKDVQDPEVCADICNRDCDCHLFEYDPLGCMCTFFPNTKDLEIVRFPAVPETIVCRHWALGHPNCRECEKNLAWEPECEGDSDRYKPKSLA